MPQIYTLLKKKIIIINLLTRSERRPEQFKKAFSLFIVLGDLMISSYIPPCEMVDVDEGSVKSSFGSKILQKQQDICY